MAVVRSVARVAAFGGCATLASYLCMWCVFVCLYTDIS